MFMDKKNVMMVISIHLIYVIPVLLVVQNFVMSALMVDVRNVKMDSNLFLKHNNVFLFVEISKLLVMKIVMIIILSYLMDVINVNLNVRIHVQIV